MDLPVAFEQVTLSMIHDCGCGFNYHNITHVWKKKLEKQ
jgi:hypothetical protein